MEVDAEEALARCRKLALMAVEDACTVGGRLSWYFIHQGEIDFAYELHLIDRDRHRELSKEWATHKPQWSNSWKDE